MQGGRFVVFKLARIIRALVIVAGAHSLFAAAFMVPTNAHAQTVKRLAANFLNFDGSEVHADGALNTTASPIGIYSKTVKVPASLDTLYITISATGDADNGAQTLIECLVDGQPCTASSTADNDAPPGFVVVQEHAGITLDSLLGNVNFGQFNGRTNQDNFHDNSIHYEWCAPITSGKGRNKSMHTVRLNLATSGPGDGSTPSNGGGDAWIEQIHVFVDGSKLGKGNGCTVMTNP
jgi:hypothetical protein